jgi:hypothetical protein
MPAIMKTDHKQAELPQQIKVSCLTEQQRELGKKNGQVATSQSAQLNPVVK